MQTNLTIEHKEQIGPAWWRLIITSANLMVTPGQFLLVCCSPLAERNSGLLLRRPIFPYQLNNSQFCILLRPEPDPGLAWLLSRHPGDTLNVLGPFGTGFPLPSGINNLLLVSDSLLLAPLLGQIQQALTRQISITLALGASRASMLYPIANLPPAVEFQVATLDGSAGHHGQVTDLLPNLLQWADVVAAVGSTYLYQTLKILAQAQRFGHAAGFTYGLFPNPFLPCGVGACFSCSIQTTTGLKLSCIDGPVFDLMTLEMENEKVG